MAIGGERDYHHDQLIGVTASDVLRLLPTFPWRVYRNGVFVDAKLRSICVVDYDNYPQKDENDDFGVYPVTSGNPIEEELMGYLLAPKKDKTIGLTSLAQASLEEDDPFEDYRTYHIPMIDIDDPEGIHQTQVTNWIKQRVIENTELTEGIVLSSGTKGHFHFIGTGRLFSPDEYRIFLGHCLATKGHGEKPLADPRWVGHGLDAASFLGGEYRKSIYDTNHFFEILRLTTGGDKEQQPKVVAVL